MKKLFGILIFLVGAGQIQAQDEQEKVKAAVNLLFEGMKSADGQKVRAAFADSAVLQTIVSPAGGQVRIRNEEVEDFARFVSEQKAGDADERIEFETIKIDGALAIVWTPYKFYYKGQFSHCGVNSFQLVKLPSGWKIQYLIDTRRREGCE